MDAPSHLDPGNVKIYTVNGAPSGSSTSLPDWLTRKREAKGKGKRRAIKEHIEGTIDLIQHFEFPEASIRIKTTRDGHHALATGVYKPQMRVYDLDQLSLKFERHSDSENVDFLILSDDWTKTLHLQNDRTIEFHTQGGLHYRTRIPRFGRSIAYHYPSCDTLISAAGPEIYRLNLDQGRFLNPITLGGDDAGGELEGVNAIDINPAHQLLSFGVDGNGTVEFWDPRSRSRVGLLRLPRAQLMPASGALSNALPMITDDPKFKSVSRGSLSVTALASRADGLSLAVGTSTGHTLLYDIRSPRPYAVKDQGYGLPVKTVAWIEGGHRMAGDGMVISADKKVVKIWDRNSPASNFASVTPATDINDVHHVPGSGLVMLANEGIQMTTFYIPQLGPAPKWCSFLDNITEEMEDQTVRSLYEDYKFVERSELASLGLDHLIGTPTLKPYMHGYFLSLRLYDAARLIANPFAYAEHREKTIKSKMEKLAENRIRSRKNEPKVNKALAERIRKNEEREEKKRARRAGGAEAEADDAVDTGEGGKGEKKNKAEKTNLLNDPRFKELFENPQFEVDERSREFGMLNPSTVTSSSKRAKTAVEDEEEESDRVSSDGLGQSDEEDGENASGSDDSSDAGDLDQYDPRSRPPAGKARGGEPRHATSSHARKAAVRGRGPRMVSARPTNPQDRGGLDRSASFGQRLRDTSSHSARDRGSGGGAQGAKSVKGGMELSWVPSSTKRTREEARGSGGGAGKKDSRKGVETFGAGMEKGSAREMFGATGTEAERHGRTQRRRGIRSGSRNAFRQM
ncbi:hypothetical protein BOTBODRAFT_37625 [Botryobasidium botryosum FD-172 SS1]|uniref:Uncharacterized protein n=1 Tax=Botryobasidium botryosum (strain FD-172 SS1) TaxID=930990 RepID=A0A067MAY9_BOTB1|nr:hypothetical protein BOTBODRAFT_37625 [Botryobasidium botryosum FD-172 SS1]